MAGHLSRGHIVEGNAWEPKPTLLQIINAMVIISKLKLGFSGDFHKVGTIISCLDKISWLDMSCWGVKVIRAILQCHLTHTCDYFDALGL